MCTFLSKKRNSLLCTLYQGSSITTFSLVYSFIVETSTTSLNNPQTTKSGGINPKTAVIDVAAKLVKDQPAQGNSRELGEGLAATMSNLSPNQFKIPVFNTDGNIDDISKPSLSEAQSNIDNDQKQEIINSIDDAQAELTPNENPDEISLDEEATGSWLGATNMIKDSSKGLFSMVGGVFGDALPAAKQLLNINMGSKKNKTATHVGMLGAGLVGLSSLNHVIKAGSAFFGRRDSQVPGIYYLLEALAQGGFMANIFKSASQGKLNIKKTLYQAAGLVGLKVGENVLDGTAPKGLDYVGGDVLKALSNVIKELCRPEQGGGGAPGAPPQG